MSGCQVSEMDVDRITHSVDSGCAVSDVCARPCDAGVIPELGRTLRNYGIRLSPEHDGRQLRDWGKPRPRLRPQSSHLILFANLAIVLLARPSPSVLSCLANGALMFQMKSLRATPPESGFQSKGMTVEASRHVLIFHRFWVLTFST